jgi:two-component system, NtrC family, nitrogen regulation sensor histidine kinase NtrY
MSLKAKLWIWAASIYLVTGFVAWSLLSINKWYFVAAEAAILISFGVFLWIRRSLFRPITAISEGIKMLEEQDFNTRLVPTGQKETDQLINVYNRMLDALRHERVQQEETHFFLRKLIDASPQGIIILDFDENIKDVNPAAASILGLSKEKILGLPLASLPGAWGKTLAAGTIKPGQITHMGGRRSYRIERATFSDKGFNRPFILIEEQTREIMALERQAYEKVIRMMSHEVNNSAGAVNSLLSSLESYYSYLPEEEKEDYRSALSVSIHRNENLSQFMSNLASVVKLPPPKPAPMDLHQLLKDVLRLMTPRMKDHFIEIQLQLSTTPMMVVADQVQMEQVVVNILKNGMEAIQQNGTIEVQTTAEPPSLFIRNNGEPISEETRLKLFTPFFSTKKHGQGVGLTLIREVLSNHGFTYELETLENGWTEFRVGFENSDG